MFGITNDPHHVAAGVSTLQEKLRQRRRHLGMTYDQLAARSGISSATAKRIITGEIAAASLGHVVALASAMGLSLVPKDEASAEAMKERAARDQAIRLVKMVQGTSALESQAVSDEEADRLARQSFHRLMAGPPRRIWAQ
jgi:transcriptional regulator with XRE-family HTH domain